MQVITHELINFYSISVMLFQDAFSLLAYSDPWNSPVGAQLDPVQREPVCAALNSAILGKWLNNVCSFIWSANIKQYDCFDMFTVLFVFSEGINEFTFWKNNLRLFATSVDWVCPIHMHSPIWLSAGGITVAKAFKKSSEKPYTLNVQTGIDLHLWQIRNGWKSHSSAPVLNNYLVYQ